MPLPALLFALTGAHAAEVQLEGFYRARGRAFDTLSLARDVVPAGDGVSERGALYAQHRLWLRPRVVLSDQVSVYAEFRGLDNVLWGQDRALYPSFTPYPADIFEYGLTAPRTLGGAAAVAPELDQQGTASGLDFTLWRAWGEVFTPYGRFTVGRVPLHWGLGIWLNDGVTTDPDFADYGDTTDRVMWEYLVQDQVYVRAAIDIPTENLIGRRDDTTSVNAAVAYRTEDITAGILLQYDRYGRDRADATSGFDLFTVDAAADIRLGKLHAAVEGVGHFGSGDLSGSNEATVFALGAAGDVSLDLEPWTLQLRGGFASGDGTDQNSTFNAYTFDRDYSVGMFLFEQPMPVLQDGTGVRTFDEVRSGTSISNAMFVKPQVTRRLLDGLDVYAAYLTARTARGVNDDSEEGPNNAGYGHELQLGISYKGIDHVELDGRAGAFIPGTFFRDGRNYLTGAGEQGAFNEPAFGAQLTGRITF